ncbi:hypothetical protein LINPERHAP1_LOCUS12884, partial [Linum perenne]
SHEIQQCTQVISSQNNYITGVIIQHDTTLSHKTSSNTNSTHIHTSTTQLTIHSFTVTDINQAQPTNPSTSTHNQIPLHIHPFIWTHTYSTMHTRHINHNHTLDKYITNTHSFIYVSSLGAIRSCSPATPPATDAPTLPGGSKTHPQRIQIPWTSQSLPQELATNPRYSTKVIYHRRPDSILILGIQPR